MRRIAGENHRAMDKAFKTAALKAINRNPLQFEITMAQHAFNARAHHFGLPFMFCIGIGGKLQIYPPDIIRLLVQQAGLPRMKGRVEPEPALHREGCCHAHIGNQKLVFKLLTHEIQPKQ